MPKYKIYGYRKEEDPKLPDNWVWNASLVVDTFAEYYELNVRDYSHIIWVAGEVDHNNTGLGGRIGIQRRANTLINSGHPYPEGFLPRDYIPPSVVHEVLTGAGPRKPIPKVPFEVFQDPKKFTHVDYMAAVRASCKGIK